MDREQILSRKTIRSETVPVPEWETTVEVRSMSGVERDAYEHDNYQRKEAGTDPTVNFRARLLVRCLCNGDGKPLFQPDDADALGSTQDGALLIRLFDVATRLNGMKPEVPDAKK